MVALDYGHRLYFSSSILVCFCFVLFSFDCLFVCLFLFFLFVFFFFPLLISTESYLGLSNLFLSQNHEEFNKFHSL